MEHRIGLREANHNLARYVKAVEAGDEVVITHRGRPVARLVPIGVAPFMAPARRAAYERMVARMERGVSLGGLRVSRDELYDR